MVRSAIQKARTLWEWSGWARQRYGTVAGLRLARQLRQAGWRASPGTQLRLDIPELRAPIWVRARTSDSLVVQQLFERRELDFEVRPSPATVLDAGANIGLASVIFAHRFPSASILALEVDPGNFAMLRRNTAPYPNVRPVFAGLWGRRTQLAIQNPEDEAFGLRVDEAASGTIDAWDMPEVLRQMAIDRLSLLKVDIEGAELSVFGADDVDWLARIDTVAVETHDRFQPGCSDAVRSAVARFGFDERMCGEYHVFTRRPGSTATGVRPS